MAETEPTNKGVMITLAYLWPFALVPLLFDRQDPEVHWHARHGLVLMAAEVILLVLFTLLAMAVSLASVSLGCVLFLVLAFGWVAMIFLHVGAIVKGVNGKRLVLPIVSQYADRF
jgi:uncharacterized membrane protein